ncbi:hypothetical protein QQS21_002674 [Conoideocrella luteorostrata]|uniref:HAUS augmin-like complex subunit 3 N-terminal domain-containing protein n=1 Tax=Conoideocrella luteorostrata TaxID=1105319 RepID=A0AAJ0CYV7_9HYPO|nr:hypothetical protein QQS21_002674 [Conoideocrella luteorostrata]
MDSDQRKHIEDLILKASRTCGLQTRREDVQAALRDPDHGPQLAEWAFLHLGSDTLLATDELQTYMELDKSGRVDQLTDVHDLSEVQAVTEAELRLATEQLKRSTENISKQTETLQQQQDVLLQLVEAQAENATRREELGRVQRRRKDRERNQLKKEVEHITRDIRLRLDELEQQGPALNDCIATCLQSDDKLLLSLQKLGWELDQPDPDETQAVDKMRETCMRLIKTTVETVRTRLDTSYLETLVTAERCSNVAPATNEEVKELQEEVESLYSEILSVAQMSMEKQHLEPVLKSVAAKSGQSLGKTASSLKYIDECLTYLLDRMARLHTYVESHKSYQDASAEIALTARAEIAVEAAPALKEPRQATLVSPIRNARTRRRSSDIHDEPPLETLLHSLAVSLPPQEENPRKKLDALGKVLAERTRKCDDVLKGAQESFELALKAHLQDARLAIQLLKDSLLAESPFGAVQLVDTDIEGSILVLEQEVEKAKEKLRALEEQSVMAGSIKREELIQRWGSD